MAILFDGDDYLPKDYSGTGPISSYPFKMAAMFGAVIPIINCSGLRKTISMTGTWNQTIL